MPEGEPEGGFKGPAEMSYVGLPTSAPPSDPLGPKPESLEPGGIDLDGLGTARAAWGRGGFSRGAVFGDYEILGQIATGGMATVYLARVVQGRAQGELVAIKKIHPHLEREENFAKMFLDEARVASRIEHPNVVRARALENLNGLCLVMDYVDGDQLRRFMQSPGTPNGRIPLGVALRIADDMLHGLHAAHELRDGAGSALAVVHRDVSPQNVLVGRDGVTRVTDFGIARARGRLAVTREGLVRGKLRYMAPEQARPRGAPPDRRADVFAAGIILWEMLSGKRLFRGDEATVMDKLLNLATPRPRPNDGELDPGLSAAVMKALERDPEDRHPTAKAFATALRRAAASMECAADHDAVADFVEAVIGPRQPDPELHPEQEAGSTTDVEVLFSANRNLMRSSGGAPAMDGPVECKSSWPAPPMRELPQAVGEAPRPGSPGELERIAPDASEASVEPGEARAITPEATRIERAEETLAATPDPPLERGRNRMIFAVVAVWALVLTLALMLWRV